MDAKTFETRLKEITEKANREIVELVLEARKEEFGSEFGFDGKQSLSFADNPQIERLADSLAETCGWIYDRLNGMTRLDKKSMTRKLRKVLGYNG